MEGGRRRRLRYGTTHARKHRTVRMRMPLIRWLEKGGERVRSRIDNDAGVVEGRLRCCQRHAIKTPDAYATRRFYRTPTPYYRVTHFLLFSTLNPVKPVSSSSNFFFLLLAVLVHLLAIIIQSVPGFFFCKENVLILISC